jgi:hypothetical protein
MPWRNPWTFWGAVALVLTLVSVPSIEWVSALSEYGRFLSGWDPAPLKPTRLNYHPHAGGEGGIRLKTAEFRHRAPKAKSVELVGDFNAWKPGLLKMTRAGEGWWRLSVPVPEGRRKYLYLVDGEPEVDAKAPTTDGPEGRRVSVLEVE